MKLISVTAGCYNEEQNVELLYDRLRKVFEQLPNYNYEIIIIDNASTDNTVAILKQLAKKDKNLRVIVNNRNFGATRSCYHAFLLARGDAVIPMAADLQDPPELIPEMVRLWEQGEQVIMAVKTQSEESQLMFFLRTIYYKSLNAMANIELIEHVTGFGLYDKRVLIELRKLSDTYPYFRGLIAELGFRPYKIPFVQPQRKFGKSRYSWFDLYDMAMVGLTSHSIVPMRMATIMGFFLAIVSLLVALFYLLYKLIFWRSFAVGIAPLLIGMFGMFSVQLMFIGLLGEYIGASHRQVLNRPLVVEKERINFEPTDTG